MALSFIKKIAGTIGGELAVTAGIAGLFALWQLPLALLLPISLIWCMVIISLNFLHSVASIRPRGSKIVVMLLMSGALVITMIALILGLFRTPEAVKKIEAEVTNAIKVGRGAEPHSIRCQDCPASWRNEGMAVLLTSAPIQQERRTVAFSPFVVELFSDKSVLISLWAIAALFVLAAVFVGFGSVIAVVSGGTNPPGSSPVA
jgi:small-conductance mechanosensitive channel